MIFSRLFWDIYSTEATDNSLVNELYHIPDLFGYFPWMCIPFLLLLTLDNNRPLLTKFEGFLREWIIRPVEGTDCTLRSLWPYYGFSATLVQIHPPVLSR
jgi:hypothetical protein